MHVNSLAFVFVAALALPATTFAGDSACCKESGNHACCTKHMATAAHDPGTWLDGIEVLLTLGGGLTTPEEMFLAPARQRAVVWFHRPVWVGRNVLMGKYIIEHDTDRQARGELYAHLCRRSTEHSGRRVPLHASRRKEKRARRGAAAANGRRGPETSPVPVCRGGCGPRVPESLKGDGAGDRCGAQVHRPHERSRRRTELSLWVGVGHETTVAKSRADCIRKPLGFDSRGRRTYGGNAARSRHSR